MHPKKQLWLTINLLCGAAVLAGYDYGSAEDTTVAPWEVSLSTLER